ncbi:MAG TPA: PKD domain-containing protein, partial [Chitinophagaceae bacterium]|nr:PKD domain-containing protein [Chitinophagaceae bacterium]
WPYFQGDNKPYNEFNADSNKVGAPFDPARPLNKSRNNTGLTELPPAQKAFIWYPYGLSEEFPMLGSAGRSATGGPVYRKADFKNAKSPYPEYYEGKWFIVDFMRGWIMVVSMDENGNYKSMERFLPKEGFSSAIDMDFSPYDGDLYVLEYGTAWFKGNTNARLVRIEYNAGNRKPEVLIGANKTSGALPLNVQLNTTGTVDYDGDELTYSWKVTGGGATRTLKGASPTVKFDKPGTYKVTLTATDPKGLSNSKTLEIKAGNEPPAVAIDLGKANRTFYFPGNTLNYAVKVSDKEDGSLASGRITPAQVAVSIDYLPIGYDQIEASQTHRGVDMSAFNTTGQILISRNDCKSCHTMDKKSVGPSYLQVARKYKGTPGNIDKLARKIIQGGGGVWGEHAMSAHPQLAVTDARSMAEYIVNLDEKKAAVKSRPVKGTYTLSDTVKTKGTYILRAAYRDRGTAAMQPIVSEEVVILRHPQLLPDLADDAKNTNLITTLNKQFFVIAPVSYLAYKDIDLTGIASIDFSVQANTRFAAAGGVIEVRLDSPDGTLIGQTPMVEVTAPPQRPAQQPAAGTAPAQGTTTAPAQTQPAAPRRTGPYSAPLQPTTGKHTLYFVFRNDKATPGQTLMQVSNIEVKQAKEVAGN